MPRQRAEALRAGALGLAVIMASCVSRCCAPLVCMPPAGTVAPWLEDQWWSAARKAAPRARSSVVGLGPNGHRMLRQPGALPPGSPRRDGSAAPGLEARLPTVPKKAAVPLAAEQGQRTASPRRTTMRRKVPGASCARSSRRGCSMRAPAATVNIGLGAIAAFSAQRSAGRLQNSGRPQSAHRPQGYAAWQSALGHHQAARAPARRRRAPSAGLRGFRQGQPQRLKRMPDREVW